MIVGSFTCQFEMEETNTIFSALQFAVLRAQIRLYQQMVEGKPLSPELLTKLVPPVHDNQERATSSQTSEPPAQSTPVSRTRNDDDDDDDNDNNDNNTDGKVVFHKNQQFDTFDDFMSQLHNYEKQNWVLYSTTHSTPQEGIKYLNKEYSCIHSGKEIKSRGKALKSASYFATHCRSRIRVSKTLPHDHSFLVLAG